MSFNYSVQLNDTAGVGATDDAVLVYDLQQALGVWSSYIAGLGTLVVNLTIASTAEGREAGGPTSSYFVRTTAGGTNIFEPSSLYELTTGNHVSGTTSDITITIDPSYFQYLDLAQSLTYSSQVPSNEYNPIDLFLHELGHGFGITGWYSQTGTLPGNYESTFDSDIQITSGGAAYFTGANAEAVFGGPIPLTYSSSAGQNYYHFGNTLSDISRTPSTVQDPLTLDLMNGIVFFFDYQYQISNLDLAVFEDLGYDITVVFAGQTRTVPSGQTSNGLTIENGGTVIVLSGGVATNAVIDSGGVETVNSGGTTSATTISGGMLELASGGIASGPITFSGAGGTLKIDGPGNDTVSGDAGANTVDYTNLTTPGLVAIIQGGDGTVNKGGANGSDTLTGVQDLVDTGAGRTNGDVFYVDAIETVTAGSGNFNYLIELSASVNLAYGTNFTGITEFVSNTGTNLVDFSNDSHFAYLFGSTGNDTLTLGSGGGYLFGEGGTNILNGGANATNFFVGGGGGTDIMNGGTGGAPNVYLVDGTIAGGAANFYFVDGNDQVNGAGAFNTMIELVSGVTVQLGSAQYQDVQEFVANGGTNAVTVANTDSDFTYLYGGVGNDTLSTGSVGGYLIGEGGTNVLTGGGGINVFVANGASGFDTMNGGSGSNLYYIDANSTVNGAGTFNNVIELQQNATLTLGSAQLGTDVQQVILNGGTNTADFHTATSTVYLYGGAGNDTLFGGSGNDFLYGGAGTNTFEFATGWGHDTIMDWTTGTSNQIDLTALSGLGVHAITDLTQTITAGNDVITSSHTGTNSITLMGVGSALTASSFHFA
jgi:autotransporter passenger strand-loop-strand repeat protein